MGKKIEKISGKDFCNPNGQYACSPSMHDIGRLQVKINEIIEWIEEREKELPEPVIRETIKPDFGDTELVFERCDKNLLESIFDKDKRDEEDKNNTGEWKEKFREIDSVYDRGVRGGTGRGAVDWQLEDRYISFIEQLLEEDRRRSFNDLIKKLTDSDY